MKPSHFTKEPATVEAQLNKLEERGCVVEDRAYARSVLEKINYYRLANYFAVYLDDRKKRYKEGTSFNKALRLYDFDRRLRGQLLIYLEEIEISMRAIISNFHAYKYGALGYLNESHFAHNHNHVRFRAKIDRLQEKNSHLNFVNHYRSKHDGAFPLWVMMELFSFGMLSFFFDDMHQSDKKEIAERHFGGGTSSGGQFGARHIESWLSSLAELRNQCAHYCRLYANEFKPSPKPLEDAPYKMAGKLFDYIYVIRLLYIKREGGESNLALHLRTLIDEYSDVAELGVMGFPEEWEEVLA